MIIKSYFKRMMVQNYQNRLRKKYCNKDVSIISNSCLGGVCYHQLGLKFNSPTINMWIELKGFLSFCENIESYIKHDIESIDLGCNHPTGMLKPEGLEPVIIHFNHYASFDEGKNKWDERKKRIIFDRIIVFLDLSAMTSIDKMILSKLNNIPFPKIIFGCLDRKDIPDYYYVNFYKDIRPTKICSYEKRGKLFLNQVDYIGILNNLYK